MPRVFEGNLAAPDGRLAIVVSRYNESITRKLLDGALATLREHGVARRANRRRLGARRVRIPLVADRLAASGRYRGRDLPGRGDPRRDDARSAHQPCGQPGLDARPGCGTGVPVLFGVLTCDTLEQAIHRAGGNVGNKGSECAEAALGNGQPAEPS